MQTIKKKGYAAKSQPKQEIVTLANEVSRFVAANRNIVMIVGAVLATALLATVGVSFKRSYDERNAAPLFDAAYSLYSPRSGANPDLGKAYDLFRDVHSKYPSSVSGRMAALYAANCLADLGRKDEALKRYQSFVQEYGSDTLMTGLAYQRMGYLYMALGNQAEAIKAFGQADSRLGPGIATVELARLYDASGNSAESLKKYKEIADKLPGSPWAMEAMGKVQSLQPGSAATTTKNTSAENK
jgi:tetratricopeptide (TPR) repeat protein